MKKNFSKSLLAALALTTVIGGPTIAQADSASIGVGTDSVSTEVSEPIDSKEESNKKVEEDTTKKVDSSTQTEKEEKKEEKEEIDDGIAKVEEIQEETVENIQPENTAETIENKVEEKVQLVNNEANNEIVEEKVQIQNNNTNNKETFTENKDNSLEISEENKVDEVKESKESKEKSTRGIEELNKLDNKNLNKDRLQFLEKLASQVDNVPYISDPNKNPEIYKESEPDSLTCSEYASWGLYHTGHTEIGNHYVRDFYSDSKNFTRLTDKDTLLPGDLILDYKEGNKAGHILVYAGKDADGNEIVLHSTRVKGSNPNEQFLQNGPNIIKRSDYQIVNSYPILVRYNGFEKIQTQPAESASDNNYASETNKNTIDNFQVDDIKITRADDPSKESYFEAPYNFNISFSNTGKIKEGDSLKLIGYYPKLYNTETKEEYNFGAFPYQSKAYDEKVKQDIKVKYGNKEIVIGQLAGNKITFNKNVESLDKFNFSVNLGIASSNRLNVEKEGRKDLYEVPFYVNINGKSLSKPYLQKIRPNTREKLVAWDNNFVRGRIYNLPTEKNKQVLRLYDNPYGALAKLRDENRWQNDKISVKITLPEGLEFENNQDIERKTLFYYTNDKKIVLADNHDINRHYDQHRGILSSLTTIKDDKTAINNFDITDKPLGKNEGRYDRTNVGALVSIMDSNAIDLKTGKLKNPIKFEYFINGKLVDTQELMDVEMQTTSSSSDGSADQSSTTAKEEIKAKMLYEADDSLEFGKQVVVKKPVNGEKEITITKKIVDGKVVEEKSEKVIKQKQDGLTKIGNKKVVEEEIPPIKGGTKPGKKTTTTIYEVDKNTGELINPKVTTRISYPAEKIQDISKKVTHEDINYNTIYKKDETLKHGEKKIVQKGAKGNKEITQIGSNKPTEKIIKKPIDEIVRIGNKKIVEEEIPAIDGGKPGKKTTTTVWDVNPKTGELINPKETVKISYPMEDIQDIATKTTKDIADVDFEIIYEADSNLEYGKTQIKQDGKKGKKEITIISKVVDGKRVEEKSEKIIKKPTSKIISVGNREVINKEIPYKTIKKETKDLEIGQSKVQTKGITGVETTTKVYEIDKNTGKLINPKESKKITKEKVDEVILIGTKKVIPAEEIEDIAKTTKVTKEVIPAENKYIADEELEFEKQETDKEAKDGEKEITTTSKVVDGERQETTEEKVIKDAENGVIRVGNKKVEVKDLDPLYDGGESGTETITTIYEVDPNTGELINPKSTSKTTYPMTEIEDIAKPITKDQGTQTPPETKDESTQTPPETSDKGTQTEDENKDKVPSIVAEKVNKVEKTTQTEPETKEVKEEKVTSNQPVQNTQPANKSTNSRAGKNVKTGVSGIAGIVATLGTAITGLFASKKKED